jgi:hypothetical protein
MTNSPPANSIDVLRAFPTKHRNSRITRAVTNEAPALLLTHRIAVTDMQTCDDCGARVVGNAGSPRTCDLCYANRLFFGPTQIIQRTTRAVK